MVDIRETMYMSIQLKDRSLFLRILLMLKNQTSKNSDLENSQDFFTELKYFKLFIDVFCHVYTIESRL